MQRRNFKEVMFAAEVLLGGQMTIRLAFTSDPWRVEGIGALPAGEPLGYLTTLVKVTQDQYPAHCGVNSTGNLQAH